MATLSRNVPSAMLRFVFYEEIKRMLGAQNYNGKVLSLRFASRLLR